MEMFLFNSGTVLAVFYYMNVLFISGQINIPGADLGAVGLQLCATEGSSAAADGGDEEESSPVSAQEASSSLPTSVSVVTNRDNQRIILFAKTEFLATLAKGEVFNN